MKLPRFNLAALHRTISQGQKEAGKGRKLRLLALAMRGTARPKEDEGAGWDGWCLLITPAENWPTGFISDLHLLVESSLSRLHGWFEEGAFPSEHIEWGIYGKSILIEIPGDPFDAAGDGHWDLSNPAKLEDLAGGMFQPGANGLMGANRQSQR